jgi:hypothetical protein
MYLPDTTPSTPQLVRLSNTKKPKLSLSQTINLRGRIAALSTPEAQAGFVHNGLVYATARFRYDPAMPASEIARRNRAAVAEVVGDPATIDVLCAVAREQHRRDQPLHICEPFERSYHITNWAPAWRDLDFGPALATATAGGAKERRKVGLIVHGDGQEPGVPTRCECTPLPPSPPFWGKERWTGHEMTGANQSPI